jgi:hypothetical protein
LPSFRRSELRSLRADCQNKLDDTTNSPRAPKVREDGASSDSNHPWNAQPTRR